MRVSLKLGRKAAKDHPGDHVAADVNSSESTDTSNKRRWVAINSDLRIGITALTFTIVTYTGEVNLSTSNVALIIVSLELVYHECIVSILKDRDILKLFQEYGDVSSGHKESSKKHERDDQHRGQCNSKLLVRETAGDDQGVSTTSVVDQCEND